MPLPAGRDIQLPRGKGYTMARPKKETEITHTRHINLRLTDTQYDILSIAAGQAGLSLSEYIRRQVLKGKVIAKYEIVADVPELKKLIATVEKNMRKAAADLNFEAAMELRDKMTDLKKMLNELTEGL